MATEILPSTTDPLTYTRRRTRPVGGRQSTEDTWTGPLANVLVKEAALWAGKSALTGLASLEVTEQDNGRAVLVARYEPSTLGNNVPGREDAIQELRRLKVVRDIYTAPYFSSLTSDEVIEVRNFFERGISDPVSPSLSGGPNFTDLQDKLYGHLAKGQESYEDIAYEFAQSWRTTSDKRIRLACSGALRVSALPKLNATTALLVKDIKWTDSAGAPHEFEWRKEPTECTYAGRGYYDLVERWIGLPQWSVMYGGTFTGASS